MHQREIPHQEKPVHDDPQVAVLQDEWEGSTITESETEPKDVLSQKDPIETELAEEKEIDDDRLSAAPLLKEANSCTLQQEVQQDAADASDMHPLKIPVLEDPANAQVLTETDH